MNHLSQRIYGSLLHLLPASRREQHGNDMALVFAEQLDHARREGGRAASAIVWMRELAGLLVTGLRARLGALRAVVLPERVPAGGPGRAPGLRDDLRWAWRGLRGRGRRAALTVGLLGATLAGNGLLFAAADSLLFRPLPYRDPDALVAIHTQVKAGSRADDFMSAARLEAWRAQGDLFTSVHAYLGKNVFVVGQGTADLVPTADVTPGLIDMLGAAPRWGRGLRAGDETDVALQTVVISESLARRQFGDPARAVGQRIETTAQPLTVVGVMPATFRFPTSTVEIWRALDPRGDLTRNFAGVRSVARRASGLSADALAAQMTARSAAVAGAAGLTVPAAVSVQPLAVGRNALQQRPTLLMLLGAALCVLLTACANIASLELTGAIRRSRTAAIQLALGASRAMLARVALLEGALLIAAALLVAVVVGRAAATLLSTLEASNPTRFAINPVDIDGRALFYMTIIAALAWLLTSLPVVIQAMRADLQRVLKADDRGASASRSSTRLRQFLTTSEVAIAVLLLVGTGLYLRTTSKLVMLDKGFDSRHLAGVSFTIPSQFYAGFGEMHELAARTLARVQAVPGVTGATWASALPGGGWEVWGDVKLDVDDREPDSSPAGIATSPVDATYFAVIGLPVLRGRTFLPDDQSSAAVVTAAFADRYWPGQDPVGRRFRRRAEEPWSEVIGVVGGMRSGPRRAPSASDDTFFYYKARPPLGPPPATATAPRRIDTGGSYRFLALTVRMDDDARAAAVLAAARAIDPRLRVTLTMVDDAYAERFGDTTMATRVIAAFGLLAFVLAIVGIYSVMAFLVTTRQRELGIRVTLGATPHHIRQLVVGSSLRLVGVGAAAGLVLAAALSKYVEAEMFEVSATDPLTYLAVAGLVATVSLVATLIPARDAARTDPSVTLRAD